MPRCNQNAYRVALLSLAAFFVFVDRRSILHADPQLRGVNFGV